MNTPAWHEQQQKVLAVHPTARCVLVDGVAF